MEAECSKCRFYAKRKPGCQNKRAPLYGMPISPDDGCSLFDRGKQTEAQDAKDEGGTIHRFAKAYDE